MKSPPQRPLPKIECLSIVIPARDEEEALPITVTHLHEALEERGIDHEIVTVDDGSTDRTWEVLQELRGKIPTLRPIRNPGPHGFGRAIIYGLDHFQGDAVIIMMADESDDCQDAIRYWETLNEGWDCAFGSRFMPGSEVIDYPKIKLALNRLANLFIRVIFNLPLNDTTNAFKAYRRDVIEGCRPFLAPHFNLTVEIPLKAAVRGFSWKVLPISWRNRRFGVAKLKIREMGSRYFFICAYVWLEKYFSRGDYRREEEEASAEESPEETVASTTSSES